MSSWNLPWAYQPRSKVSPVHNPAFWDWFRGSVVRNPDGSPRIVYHGTLSHREDQPRRKLIEMQEVSFAPAFTVFQPGSDDIGIHFGTREQASDLVDIRAGTSRGGWRGHIYPVYIRLEKPIRMVDTGQWFPFDVAERLKKGWAGSLVGVNPPILTPKEVERVVYTTDTRGHSQARKVLVSLLNAHGYDGIVYQNLYEGNKKDDSYIVFDPAQIKSAYGNRGTFDPDDPDILNGGW